MSKTCIDPGALYLPGAYKGVAFEAVFSSETDGGRRAALGEFPFNDRVATLDLGRRMRHFKLRVRYAGTESVANARELLAACESPGPGDLEVPDIGIVDALCLHVKLTSRPFEAAGETYLDMEFAENNPEWWGGGVLSFVPIDVGPIRTAAQNLVASGFNVTGLPFYAIDAATGIVAGLAAQINTSLLRVAGVAPDKNVFTISADLEQIAADPTSVLTDGTAWQVINNGLASVSYYATSVAAVSDEMRTVANWAAAYRVATGETAAAQSSVIAATRLVAASYIAKIGAEKEIKTLGEGLAEFDRVMAILEDEWNAAKAVCDDVTMLAIDRFRVNAGKALLSRAYAQPGIVVYDFGGPVSSLAAAYELYNDATRFADLEALNITSFPWSLGPDVVASRA